MNLQHRVERLEQKINPPLPDDVQDWTNEQLYRYLGLELESKDINEQLHRIAHGAGQE